MLKSGGMSAARASFGNGKMTVTRRPKSPLNGAPFLQAVQDPNPSCRSSAGQFNLFHILQNESGAWIGRVGELAPSQLQQLPVLVQSQFRVRAGEVTVQDWSSSGL